jgi:hypothetical protein
MRARRESLCTDSLDSDRFRPLMWLTRDILCKIFLHSICGAQNRSRAKSYRSIVQKFFARGALREIPLMQISLILSLFLERSRRQRVVVTLAAHKRRRND